MKKFDVIILGAGAAGLMCAFTAANRGRSVLILERSNKVGKKILMSGGGRCNFTNLYTDPDNFLSQNLHFCKSALSRYTPDDFVRLVESHGIAFHEKARGQLFCDETSKQIVAMLREECNRSGVVIRSSIETESVRHDATFIVATDDGKYTGSKLVVATGGLSVPTLGGSGLGYEIARQFSLKVRPLQAALAPFVFTNGFGEMCQQLSGVSLPARLTCGKVSFADDLLFTHRGLSGPAALQLSSYWFPGKSIELDLLPDHNAADMIVKYKNENPKSLVRTFFNNTLPKKLVIYLEERWWQDQAQSAIANVSDTLLRDIASQFNSWIVKPSATEGYRTAEVTSGGVDTSDLDSRTMESKQQAGLYFIGEVVDVTGELGGYNFQWAWASAVAAGKSI